MMNRAVRVVVVIGNVRTDAGSLVEDTRNTVTNATAGRWGLGEGLVTRQHLFASFECGTTCMHHPVKNKRKSRGYLNETAPE